MEIQLRSYSQQGFSLALNVYRFPEDYNNRIQTLAMNYLFQHHRKDGRIRREQLENQCRTFFRKFLQEGDIQNSSEIADIFSIFVNNELIEELQDIEEAQEVVYELQERHDIRARQRVQRRKMKERTVYDDSQNVHNTKINKSVLNASKNLYNLYKEMLEPEGEDTQEFKDDYLEGIKRTFISRHVNKADLIKDTFEYIKTSNGTFGIGITLQDVLLALWLWTQDHTETSTLEIRLLEELEDMKRMCSTGHLARLVNVMQGFTEDPSLIVKISDQDQYKAVITNYLNNELKKCADEEVYESMTGGGKPFVDFIKSTINKILLEWTDSYGNDIITHIPDVVNNFTGVEIYTE